MMVMMMMIVMIMIINVSALEATLIFCWYHGNSPSDFDVSQPAERQQSILFYFHLRESPHFSLSI